MTQRRFLPAFSLNLNYPLIYPDALYQDTGDYKCFVKSIQLIRSLSHHFFTGCQKLRFAGSGCPTTIVFTETYQTGSRLRFYNLSRIIGSFLPFIRNIRCQRREPPGLPKR